MHIPHSIRIGVCLVLCAIAAPLPAQPLVAPTDALTPNEQRGKFHLPPGFVIQLVAAEPDIQKPMNLKFDARGRLWVSHSVEYPFPAADPAKARDAVTILSDLGPDGRARRVERFAEGLNIPIGLAPLPDGAIIFSIPDMQRFIDSDADGTADKRTVLFTGYQHVDTHGMNNALTRWLDGWVYACHGFRNDSKVKGDRAGEAVLAMQSGNTYRFLPDGSAIQQFTWGQVNPFGMCFDPLGNQYTADCHSLPVYMLLRGAYYPSFGKPDDGLGFGPTMIDHNHGSTGIAGVAYYAADHYPTDYRDNLFIGNPVTGRVHRDKLQWRGSSPWVDTQPDFIRSDDPWFRPVDIQLGPDGAIYVADFYNKIIGHYEVDLRHPGRDRHRGRIWRVVYVGANGDAPPPQPMPDLTKSSLDQLIERLGDANLVVATLAVHQLVDRFGAAAASPVKAAIGRADSSPLQRAHGLWVLQRTASLDDDAVQRLAADPDRLVRTHLMRAIGETSPWRPSHERIILRGLTDDDPFVRRAAAEALGLHPRPAGVEPLLATLDTADAADNHLRHVVRIALRNHLRDAAVAEALSTMSLDAARQRHLADIVMAVPGDRAAGFLLQYVRDNPVAGGELAGYLQHIAGHLDAPQVDTLATFVPDRFRDDRTFQMNLLTAIHEGLSRRNAAPGPGIRRWAEQLIEATLASSDDDADQWVNRPVPGAEPSANPWVIQQRPSQDGDTQSRFLSSLPRGEQLTGSLRSPAFNIPPKLSFYMAGHNGHPGTNPSPRNMIRLRLVADDRVVAEAVPPRHDTANRYEWDLAAHAGQRGYIEIIDNFVDTGYAWLAVGRFDPPVVTAPHVSPSQAGALRVAAVDLAGRYRVERVAPAITALIDDSAAELDVRQASARTAMRLNRSAAVVSLNRLVADARQPTPLRATAAESLASVDQSDARKALLDALAAAEGPLQRTFANALGATRPGAEALLAAIAEGKASARLLQDREIADRIKAARIPEAEQRIAALTAVLPPADERLIRLVAERRAAYLAASRDPQRPERGKSLFAQHCAACHQIGGQGAMVGPQLDGIGVRGLDRLLEDVLDPNRNVDQAFRMTIITMKDGQAHAGLPRREEGDRLILADIAGKESALPLADVAARQQLSVSLMPPTFADALTEPQLIDLIAYLLTQQAEK